MHVRVIGANESVRRLVDGVVARDGDAATGTVWLVDLTASGGAGLADCRRAVEERAASGGVVVALCAADDELGVVGALDAGVDDVVREPLRVHELVARVRAHARHRRHGAGGWVLDTAARTIVVDGRAVPASDLEVRVLRCLTERPGVHARSALLRSCWDEHTTVDERAVDDVIAALRRHLGATAIETVRGRGYRLASSR